MKTQNTPATHSDILFTHIVNTLVDLAKHEGTLMTFEGLLRNGIEVDEEMMESMLGVSQDSAAQCVVQLRDCGAITSPAVYEMVTHVEQLAMRLAPDWWKLIVPWSVQPLRYYQKEAMAKRERFIVRHRERQYPFLVYVTGQVEYPEDDPLYGTYVTEGTFLVGKAKTIHDALECAKEAFTRGEWIVQDEEGRDEFVDHLRGRDQGPVSFSERTIEIRDKGDRLVLTGNARTLEWHRHLTSPDEIEKIKAQQKDLYQKASYESGWDNYETARQLRRQAEQLSLGFVEECWRNHPEVIQAVEKFEYPVFIDEEMALFSADQDAGID